MLRDKIIYREYCQYLCYHICYFSTILVPDAHMYDTANIICKMTTILFKNIMMKIANIYVSIADYILRELLLMCEG